MSNRITQILTGLKNDPTLVIQLYEALYHSDFIVLAQPDTQTKVDSMEFLTYSTEDGVNELPIFTEEKFILNFSSMQHSIVTIKGVLLWPRLFQILKTSTFEVAVNPGQSHGIRLNNSMILGMISKYGTEAS